MNLPCEVIRDLLPLYHDGVCSAQSRALVDAHLSGCPACREELARMETELAGPGLHDDAPIREIARSWKKSRMTAFLKGALLISALAAAGCAIAYEAIGSYVAPDGTLVEPFGLIPLFYLFVLLALLFGIPLLIGRLRRRHRPS